MIENKFENILNWLADRPLIRILALGEIVGIKKGNFSSYIKKKTLPDKYLQPMIEVLQKYGYEDKSTLQIVVQKSEPPVKTIQKSMSMALLNNSLELNPCDLQTIPAPQNENTRDDAKKEETPKLSPKTPIVENSYLMKRRLSKI